MENNLVFVQSWIRCESKKLPGYNSYEDPKCPIRYTVSWYLVKKIEKMTILIKSYAPEIG